MKKNITETIMRYNYWANEAKAYLEAYLKDKSDTNWKLVCGTGDCMCIYDPKHRQKATNKIQSFLWEEGYLRGEDTLEEYMNSGYFKDKYLEMAI